MPTKLKGNITILNKQFSLATKNESKRALLIISALKLIPIMFMFFLGQPPCGIGSLFALRLIRSAPRLAAT